MNLKSSETRTTYSQLWLPHCRLEEDHARQYQGILEEVYVLRDTPIIRNARNELSASILALTGKAPCEVHTIDHAGVILLGTLEDVRATFGSVVADIGKIPAEGFVIKPLVIDGHKSTLITSMDERGLLYGVFHLLRLIQQGLSWEGPDIREKPAAQLRMLNHWDDLNGYIERGYAGSSLWKWEALPETIDARYRDYARLCASIGINGLVLNNVNADPRVLRRDYLDKIVVLANLFREWGITTYLSANYAAPLKPSQTPDKMKCWGGIGDLETADPLDPQVEAWWNRTVNEIYNVIPDFGGFLVKADSEGMLGPKTYGRNHVEGANMLARALKPHGGKLIWRAFVYGESQDRALDCYQEFVPLDGLFLENVILQAKNGPLDFQPCEPFNPLFGSMSKTALAVELQIAKEYLGHASTVAYLGTMWNQFLASDTYAEGKGTTLAGMLTGEVENYAIPCIAGVSNTGDSADWCGNVFNQVNWYAFGRLAWDPHLDARAIAEEWVAMTFGNAPMLIETLSQLLMDSYDAFVNYSMPLGLNFLCDWNHYDPNPSMRFAYHGADTEGLGIDRSSSGSKAVEQYHPGLSEIWNDPEKIPLRYLLWFHHVAWDAKLSTGRILREELEYRYKSGVDAVDRMIKTWEGLEAVVGRETFLSVSSQLAEEKKLALQWSETCLGFFAQFLKSC